MCLQYQSVVFMIGWKCNHHIWRAIIKIQHVCQAIKINNWTPLFYFIYLVVECSLPEMEHMTYSEDQALPGSMITVACDPGYILSGNDQLNCNSLGKFNQSLPSCKCKYEK